MARLLLTGGTGFIGRRVLARLSSHEVLCITRDPDRLPRGSHVYSHRADMGQAAQWLAAAEAFRPQWAIHLAWEGLPDYSEERSRSNYATGVRFLDAARRAGVERVVVSGTCWEYGSVTGPVREDAVPVRPGAFASAKLRLLNWLNEASREGAWEYRWARLFFVYGAGQRPQSLIPSLREALREGRAPNVREPATLQDFIHVDDAAAAIVALTEEQMSSGVYNVGSGQPTSVCQLANAVAGHYQAERPFPHIPAGIGFWADTTKMFAATHQRPYLSVDEGVARTLAELDAA